MRKLSLRLKHLTQEHRAAMLLATAARDAMPQSDEDLPEFVERIRNIFIQEMEPHFLEEERHALPRLRELGRDDLADRTYQEHMHMRGLIEALHEQPSALLIREFSNAMQRHVNFEEEEVWEVLEDAMEATQQS
ncbi:hemerythrin domain-containing protein [Viridibacterium curvum]|uniref:Hemerythrin-like domain-containing protein n=1 Tax=Viridibacterium curvum TaxID=1101404 RepID=A0ABP9QQL8_9RHOO